MLFFYGDVTKALSEGCHYIAHVCNAQGVMGSGVAKQIREKFPDAYEDYRHDYLCSRTEDFLGTAIVSGEIVNLVAQEYYGTDGKRYLDYGALISSLIDFLGNNSLVKIAIPSRMGCDRAGGDWEIVKEILKGFEKAYSVEFIIYDFN